MHALQSEELRDLADLKIYSDTDEALRLILKIRRSPWYKKMVGENPIDPRDFGGSFSPLPFALKSWWNGVRDGEKEHVLPTKKFADLVVTYNECEDLNKNVEKIKNLLELGLQDEKKFRQKVTELRAETKNQELVPREKVKELENKLAEREQLFSE